ncbi:MAG: hypothetical protein ACJAW3_000762 [Lentimonas sp.]|jgi:hypothetical protein
MAAILNNLEGAPPTVNKTRENLKRPREIEEVDFFDPKVQEGFLSIAQNHLSKPDYDKFEFHFNDVMNRGPSIPTETTDEAIAAAVTKDAEISYADKMFLKVCQKSLSLLEKKTEQLEVVQDEIKKNIAAEGSNLHETDRIKARIGSKIHLSTKETLLLTDISRAREILSGLPSMYNHTGEKTITTEQEEDNAKELQDIEKGSRVNFANLAASGAMLSKNTFGNLVKSIIPDLNANTVAGSSKWQEFQAARKNTMLRIVENLESNTPSQQLSDSLDNEVKNSGLIGGALKEKEREIANKKLSLKLDERIKKDKKDIEDAKSQIEKTFQDVAEKAKGQIQGDIDEKDEIRKYQILQAAMIGCSLMGVPPLGVIVDIAGPFFEGGATLANYLGSFFSTDGFFGEFAAVTDAFEIDALTTGIVNLFNGPAEILTAITQNEATAGAFQILAPLMQSPLSGVMAAALVEVFSHPTERSLDNGKKNENLVSDLIKNLKQQALKATDKTKDQFNDAIKDLEKGLTKIKVDNILCSDLSDWLVKNKDKDGLKEFLQKNFGGKEGETLFNAIEGGYLKDHVLPLRENKNFGNLLKLSQIEDVEVTKILNGAKSVFLESGQLFENALPEGKTAISIDDIFEVAPDGSSTIKAEYLRPNEEDLYVELTDSNGETKFSKVEALKIPNTEAGNVEPGKVSEEDLKIRSATFEKLANINKLQEPSKDYDANFQAAIGDVKEEKIMKEARDLVMLRDHYGSKNNEGQDLTREDVDQIMKEEYLGEKKGDKSAMAEISEGGSKEGLLNDLNEMKIANLRRKYQPPEIKKMEQENYQTPLSTSKNSPSPSPHLVGVEKVASGGKDDLQQQ